MKTWRLVSVCLVFAACGDEEVDYRAIVRGKLADGGGNNSEANRSKHDDAARMIKELAIASELQTHLAYTGLADPSAYAAIDVWTELDALRAYYDDPAVKTAWADLFSEPPTVDIWRHPRDWTEWGELTKSGAGKPGAFFFHLRNRLKSEDEEQSRITHNRVAGGASSEKAIALTDIGHFVNLNVDDPRELLFIDLWQDLGGANQFFTDPMTIAGGTEVFDTPFDATVYAPTDWHQWTKNGEESGPIDGSWAVESLQCNGEPQLIPALTVQIFNSEGNFIIDLPSTCTATISERYTYPSSSSILITPINNNCAPRADACAPVFGGATSCPTPPPVEFTFELDAGELVFARTSVGPPVDSCPAGANVRYAMRRK